MSETHVPEAQTALFLTTEVVSAYVANNQLAPAELPKLLTAVHGALSAITGGSPVAAAEPQAEPLTPAQIRKSITPDALISFIDGKPYKTLRRHLTTHGLDPASYRKRFGLPADYPLVSPNYSKQRSELAKQLRLGQRPVQQAAE